ncbi:MAG: hypothetical protein P9L97_05830 [Candidatus Tenebribacter davisii]|nr:hypothetical protein [Candidatus Tenebribacter davisii]
MVMVYNKSKEKAEKAKQGKCPNCKGMGAIHGDDAPCLLCNGYGKLWISVKGSGWTRPLYCQLNASQLY